MYRYCFYICMYSRIQRVDVIVTRRRHVHMYTRYKKEKTNEGKNFVCCTHDTQSPPPVYHPVRNPAEPHCVRRCIYSRWCGVVQRFRLGRCAFGGGSVHRKMLDWSDCPRRTTIDDRRCKF